MGSLMKSALQTGTAGLMLLAGVMIATPGAAANATGNPSAPCVPTGGVVINGGSVSNTTNLDLSADGGTALSDGSGGDDNLAVVTDRGGRRDRDRDNDRDDTAAAGNGGSADAAANGGAISVGDVNSGSNRGNTISVGDTFSSGCAQLDSRGNPVGVAAAVQIDGGTVTNETNIDISADGGTAIADASGGDDNIAVNNGGAGNAGNGGIVSAGNGGTANSSANGGAVSIGDVNSGGNSGNVITVGNTISGGIPIVPVKPVPVKPVPVKPVPVKPVPVKPAPVKPVPGKPGTKPTPAPVRALPRALPDTGTGNLVQGETNLQLLAVLAAATVMAAAAGQQVLRGWTR